MRKISSKERVRPRRRPARRVSARLVNHGHDTQLVLGDGSTIVLKGVVEADAFFHTQLARTPRSAAAD